MGFFHMINIYIEYLRLLVFYRFFQLSSALHSYIQLDMHTSVHMLKVALHVKSYLLDWYEEQHGRPYEYQGLHGCRSVIIESIEN